MIHLRRYFDTTTDPRTHTRNPAKILPRGAGGVGCCGPTSVQDPSSSIRKMTSGALRGRPGAMRLHSRRAELPLPEKPPPGVTAEAWEAVRSPIEARRAEVAAEWERMAPEREKEVRRLAWYQEKHNISSVAAWRVEVRMNEYKRQREEERQELAEMPKRLAEREAWVAERATAIETLPKVVSERRDAAFAVIPPQGLYSDALTNLEDKQHVTQTVQISEGDLADKVYGLFEEHGKPMVWREVQAALAQTLGAVQEGAVRRTVTTARRRWGDASKAPALPRAEEVVRATRELWRVQGTKSNIETLSELRRQSGLAGASAQQVRRAARIVHQEQDTNSASGARRCSCRCGATSVVAAFATAVVAAFATASVSASVADSAAGPVVARLSPDCYSRHRICHTAEIGSACTRSPSLRAVNV